MSLDGEKPKRSWLRHGVPEQVGDVDPVFFLTICCQQRGLNQLAKEPAWSFLLETVERRNARGIWHCSLFLAMPDHVHGLFRFAGTSGMKDAVADWKRWCGSRSEIVWQKGFFDHRLRSWESGEEKRRYILMNPVRAGLVEHPDHWPFVYDGSRNNR
ncbi:MAG: transposase [Verrucomicrobiota bacterium JB025]|nr:hypothetical protein [Verrucomicrobiota bacterium JB025]